MSSPSLSHSALLALILTFGFAARAITFQLPLLDHQGWRQADTASIARAFAVEHYNILYPQVAWRGGAETGYVETGLELHAFLVATIAKVSGEFRPEIGRLLSVVFFLISCRLVWTFTRRRYGDRHGLFAAYLYAFGFPLMLFMERAFMNEALLVCLSLVCLVAAQQYLERDAAAARRPRWPAFVVLSTAAALVGAVKFPYLIVLAPISGLFLERYGRRALVRLDLWMAWLLPIAASAAWYLHAHALGQQSGLTFGIVDKIFDPALLLSERFYRMVFQRIVRDVLGPLGVLGLATGAYVAWRRRHWAEVLGLAGFLAYLVLVAQGNLVHNYYQLAIMPVAATVVAAGLLHLVERIPGLSHRRDTTLVTLAVLIVLITTIRSASFHSWYEVPAADVQLCAALPAHFDSPSERVAVMGSGDPRFLFCLDRKGWLLNGDDVEGLRRAREDGARVALVYPEGIEALLPFLRDRADEIPLLMGEVRAFRLR